MSSKKTHKEQERKRREKLEARVAEDCNRRLIERRIAERLPHLSTDDPALKAEMEGFFKTGITEGAIALGKLLTEIRTELSVYPKEVSMPNIGDNIAYALGITTEAPTSASNAPTEIALPLQAKFSIDTKMRNKTVQWIKERGYNVTSRLGQPIVKLPNVVVEFRQATKPTDIQELIEQ